jgi:hypothetical protein
MGVAARLHPEPAIWGGRQVGGHDHRRAPIEGKRRLQHAPEPNRHEPCESSLVGPDEQINGIAPVFGRPPSGVRFARHCVAQRLSLGAAFVRGESPRFIARGAIPAAGNVRMLGHFSRLLSCRSRKTTSQEHPGRGDFFSLQ